MLNLCGARGHFRSLFHSCRHPYAVPACSSENWSAQGAESITARIRSRLKIHLSTCRIPVHPPLSTVIPILVAISGYQVRNRSATWLVCPPEAQAGAPFPVAPVRRWPGHGTGHRHADRSRRSQRRLPTLSGRLFFAAARAAATTTASRIAVRQQDRITSAATQRHGRHSRSSRTIASAQSGRRQSPHCNAPPSPVSDHTSTAPPSSTDPRIDAGPAGRRHPLMISGATAVRQQPPARLSAASRATRPSDRRAFCKLCRNRAS